MFEYYYLLQIYVENNSIIRLPDDIGNLEHLWVLEVRKNRLEALPDSLLKLTGLHNLDISENRFKPPEFKEIPSALMW